MPVEKE